MTKTNKERVRRNYSKEFKLEAVKLVTESGRSQSEVAQSLGIAVENVRRWCEAAQAE